MSNAQSNIVVKTADEKKVLGYGRRCLSALVLGTSLTFGIAGPVSAHCTWSHPHHCGGEIVDVAEDVGDAIVDTAEDAGDAIVDATGTVGDTVVNSANTAAKMFTQTGEFLLKIIGDAALDVYRELAELMFQQMYDPMTNMAEAWKTLVSTEPAKFDRLEAAIQNGDTSELKPAIEEVLVSLYTYAGFADIVDDFKDENAGSLLLIVSAGGGTGLTVEGDIGIALDIDYLDNFGNRVANGYTTSTFNGAIGSLFTAAGLQVGPAAGGGVDFVAGYHVANPDGVYGPGMDFSLEVKAKVGGSVGIGFDISQAPWQIVTGGIGIGAGAEVKAAVGPSYAAVLGQLCSDGSFEKFANGC